MINFDLIPYAFALILVMGGIVVFNNFAQKFLELKKKEIFLLSGSMNHPKQINFQAYERMVTFLERIKPANLVNKFDQELKPHEYLFLLEKSINEEFEYNLSQQLYINTETWQQIISAKNNIIKTLHETYQDLKPNSTLADFKTYFLTNYIERGDVVTKTIITLQQEII